MKNILLFGGGLDSAFYFLNFIEKKIPFECLWVDYGQRTRLGEVAAMAKFCSKYDVFYQETATTLISGYTAPNLLMKTGTLPFVEGRNLGLLMTALKYGDMIHMGFTDPGYTPFKDADQEFIDNMNKILSASFNEKRVSAEFIGTSRLELFKKFYKIEPRLLDMAFTCWESETLEECGVCKHCLLKAQLKASV
jgi:7-cyano-7-deazaguanine synthase in queuosine biosynthesis